MTLQKTIIIFLAASLCLTIQSCTRRAWRQGLENRERQECFNNPSNGDIQKCLQRVNDAGCDSYRIDR